MAKRRNPPVRTTSAVAAVWKVGFGFLVGAFLLITFLVAVVFAAGDPTVQGDTWHPKIEVIQNGQVVEYRTDRGLPSKDTCEAFLHGPEFMIALIALAGQVVEQDPEAEVANAPSCVGASTPWTPPRPAPAKGDPT